MENKSLWNRDIKLPLFSPSDNVDTMFHMCVFMFASLIIWIIKTFSAIVYNYRFIEIISINYQPLSHTSLSAIIPYIIISHYPIHHYQPLSHTSLSAIIPYIIISHYPIHHYQPLSHTSLSAIILIFLDGISINYQPLSHTSLKLDWYFLMVYQSIISHYPIHHWNLTDISWWYINQLSAIIPYIIETWLIFLDGISINYQPLSHTSLKLDWYFLMVYQSIISHYPIHHWNLTDISWWYISTVISFNDIIDNVY